MLAFPLKASTSEKYIKVLGSIYPHFNAAASIREANTQQQRTKPSSSAQKHHFPLSLPPKTKSKMVFLPDTYIKHMWAATFVLLVVWALAYLISAFFRGKSARPGTVGGTGRGGVLDSGAAPVTEKHPVHWRAADAAKKAETRKLTIGSTIHNKIV